MTAKEIIKKYGLEGYTVSYKNTCGNEIDDMYSVEELETMEAKDIYINFRVKKAIITVIN